MYKNLQMSQGVYFVTKGIAEAYVKVGDGSDGEEEKVKGIVSAGKFFGYSKFLAAFLEEDMAVKAFTLLGVSWHVACILPEIRKYVARFLQDFDCHMFDSLTQAMPQD